MTYAIFKYRTNAQITDLINEFKDIYIDGNGASYIR